MFLCISIFYCKSDWYKLIAFLKPIIKNSNVIGYLIFLSETRGQHIKLLINVSSRVSQTKIKTFLSSSLSSFFKHTPAIECEQTYDANSLFMNFPNNNFYYDLYDSNIFHVKEPSSILFIRKMCSALIIEKLFKYKFDENTRLSFLLYFHIELTKAVFTNQSMAEKGLVSILNKNRSKLEDDHQIILNSKKVIAENFTNFSIYLNDRWEVFPNFPQLEKLPEILSIEKLNFSNCIKNYTRISSIFCSHLNSVSLSEFCSILETVYELLLTIRKLKGLPLIANKL